MSKWIGSLIAVALAAALGLAGCTDLEKGQCKSDSHCSDMAEGRGEVWVCYKEPPDAEIGTCMRAKEARAAHERYERKKTGECEDEDGDGVKAGEACDPPVDCDDEDPEVKPGAEEICDAKDNDCDDVINEGLSRCVGTVLGGKNDPVVQFMLTMPAGVEVAPNGTIWATDQHRIYKISKQGEAERFAGSNKPGREDKKGKFARFDKPRGLAVDASGMIYVADCNNNCIRKVTPKGEVSSYAGLCSSEADATGLDELGSLEEARFWCPVDLTFDGRGNLLVVDMLNSKIKRITEQGQVELAAGRGGKEDEDGYIVFGYSDGPAKKAEFNEPAGIAVGPQGAAYIADQKNHCIRKLAGGRVSTVAGQCGSGKDKGAHADGPAKRARFHTPQALDVDAEGVIYVADTGNHCIRRIAGAKVATLAGKPGQQGYYDGPIDEARFNQPVALSVAKDGTVLVVDHGNYRIRSVNP